MRRPSRTTPQLWTNGDQLNLTYMLASDVEVWSEADLFWGLAREGKPSQSLRQRTTNPRRVGHQVLTGTDWTNPSFVTVAGCPK